LAGYSGMVKEGHDSTIRPKVKSYEFDNGRLFLDAWHADGKEMLSKRFTGWARVASVLSCAFLVPVLVFSDYGEREHVFSPLQRSVRGWWTQFFKMDVADVAKGESVGAPVGRPKSGAGSPR
jgi:hypothetical protein